MKKLEYVSEETFIKEDIEFNDEHYDLAEELRERYKSPLLSECTPVMVREDKKSLVFCVNLGDREKDRVAYANGDNAYKVIIEKIN